MNKLTDHPIHELDHLLLMANHDLRHAKNTGECFRFRSTLAATPDEKANDIGLALYWERQADHAQCRVRDLTNAIHQVTAFGH